MYLKLGASTGSATEPWSLWFGKLTNQGAVTELVEVPALCSQWFDKLTNRRSVPRKDLNLSVTELVEVTYNKWKIRYLKFYAIKLPINE